MLEGHDDVDGHVQDPQLRLRLVRLEVGHADPAQLLQGLVDVANTDPLSRVIGCGGRCSGNNYLNVILTMFANKLARFKDEKIIFVRGVYFDHFGKCQQKAFGENNKRNIIALKILLEFSK